MTSPDPSLLAAFCYARLDEDEAAAKEATPGPWVFEGDDPTDDELYSVHDGEHGDLVGVPVAFTRDRQVANGQHMARHDPARTLREVAALRSIVADCEARLAYPANAPLFNLARRTLAGVASIWSDHADYELPSSPSSAS